MNKTLRTILIYTIPLLFGIGMAILIYKLEFFGRKNIYESRINSMINVGPDSLTNHFPDLNLLEDAIYTKTGPEIKREIGGGFIIVTIAKNDSLTEFIETLKNEEKLKKISENGIFNIEVNYKKKKYQLTNFTSESQYPFPKRINHENFNDYKLIFYDYGEGEFLRDNRLKNNIEDSPNWKHGYTRGIVENLENEYEMWLIIW